MRAQRYDSDHEAFRASYRGFLKDHVLPYHAQWEQDGQVDRQVWVEAGSRGFLGFEAPEEFGGGGVRDFRFNTIIAEENTAAGASGLGFMLHNDVVLPYLMNLATPEQQARWLPGFCDGSLITAIAMTEPGTGSDLQGIATSAVRDGDDYIVNGAKVFITNGILADLVLVVVRTEVTKTPGAGLSILAIETGTPGFERGRRLEKMGMHAQDTAELIFTDARVPAANLIGQEGFGFGYLMQNLPQERLSIAVGAAAGARYVFNETLAYVKERRAFGRPVGSFQNSRFVLAEMATELELADVFLDRALEEHQQGSLTVTDAAMAKWWITEMQNRINDRCVQLHGGYGYMMEYPVAKAFIDSRVQTIYGGTTEIMKEIVGRSLGV